MKKIPAIILGCSLLFVFACTEDATETNYNSNVQSAKDYIFAEDLYVEVLNMIFMGVNNDSVLNGEPVLIDVCQVSYSQVTNKMLFDYGDFYVEGYDSKIRKGSFP